MRKNRTKGGADLIERATKHNKVNGMRGTKKQNKNPNNASLT